MARIKVTREQLDRLVRSAARGVALAAKAPKSPPPPRYTKPGPDGLNKTERAYAQHLEARKRAGEIHDYRVHALKLLIVPGVPQSEGVEGVKSVWFTPDFLVYENDGALSIHETKGFLDLASDGYLKFKAAASLWPFPFYLVRKTSKANGTWDIVRYAR